MFQRNNSWKTGFTLLEILIAILIFAIIITTVYGSYHSLSTKVKRMNESIAPYEMANLCLRRMRIDLEALFITSYPEYAFPDFNAEPDPFRIVGGNDLSENSIFAMLRFTSSEHLALNSKPYKGIAELVYYIQETDDKKYVLKRSDTLYPYPLFEKKENDPILCKNIKSVSYKFYDAEGTEFDSWNSDSPDYHYSTPRAIGIKLEMGDDLYSLMFETKVLLPAIREKRN